MGLPGLATESLASFPAIRGQQVGGSGRVSAQVEEFALKVCQVDPLLELTPSTTTTRCPFKVDAVYFSFGEHQDVAWSYQSGSSRPPPMLG
ncbi:DUF427 domain-containing protein [Halomonas sp. ML-15]|uniref:DUF427 domain-containing protein n=1 Tax=Halomonas sp. ML-15 TaxID=2773305 RepID=UPI0021E3B11C|nr:DUF427 domain-containing protein [Halomonas sp. ML-15]